VRWVRDNWWPRAIAVGLKIGANKHPEAHFGKVAIEKLQASAPGGFLIRTFEDIESAATWLKAVGV
jgi:hypothetical protein